MQDTNRLTLIARVASEPELKNLSSGVSRLDVNIVFNTAKKTNNGYEDEGNFAFITLWGKQAETMAKLLHKGRQIAIDGHLHVDTWEKDGKKNSSLKIVSESIQLIGSAKKDNNNQTSEAYQDSDEMPF